jgi:hypothetical protein
VAYAWGILLSPAVGAVFMSASTVIVAVNAMLLRRLRLSNTRNDTGVHATSGWPVWSPLTG